MVIQGYCTIPLSNYCERLQKFINDNLLWTEQMISKYSRTDNYWHQVQFLINKN